MAGAVQVFELAREMPRTENLSYSGGDEDGSRWRHSFPDMRQGTFDAIRKYPYSAAM